MTDRQLDRIIYTITAVIFALLTLIALPMAVYAIVIEDYALALGMLLVAVIGFTGATGIINY